MIQFFYDAPLINYSKNTKIIYIQKNQNYSKFFHLKELGLDDSQ